MADTSVSSIVKTPGVCGGKARIDGHRIRVQDVVIWHEEQGQSPEEIICHFPQLILAKVDAALSYYREHRDEIRQEMQETEAFVADMKRRHPSILAERLARDHAPDDQHAPGDSKV